eukprot:1172325-Rhodomonas_salina.1
MDNTGELRYLPTLSAYAICLRYLPTLNAYAICLRYMPTLHAYALPTRLSGTDPAYGAALSPYARASRCPVLTWRMLLPDPTLCLRICYALSGTDLAYGPMQNSDTTSTCLLYTSDAADDM